MEPEEFEKHHPGCAPFQQRGLWFARVVWDRGFAIVGASESVADLHAYVTDFLAAARISPLDATKGLLPDECE